MKHKYADAIEDTRLVKSVVFSIYKERLSFFFYLRENKQTNQPNVKQQLLIKTQVTL